MYYEQYKKIIDIDKNLWFIQFTQKWSGKSCTLLLFIIIYWQMGSRSHTVFLLMIVSLVTFIPTYRRLWLLFGVLIIAIKGSLFIWWSDWETVFYFYDYQNEGWKLFPGLIIHPLELMSLCLVFITSYLMSFFTARFQYVPWLQRHVLNLSVFIFGLILITQYSAFSSNITLYLWAFIIVFSHYFWYIAYTLHDINLLSGSDFIYEYGRYQPIWGGTNVPFPKGPAYLRYIESKTSEEFAITQLKGLKLLWWAYLLHVVKLLCIGDNNLRIPTLAHALADYEHGIYYPWTLAWQCFLLNFVNTMLDLTISGHIIIAICRMCGYRALRNTYKPLQSTTIAEFWNRYYYYFKELLVDLFFYPTFFRYFKTKPKVRIFFATLAAATFGNMLYHFLTILDTVKTVGLFNALMSFHVYMLYTIILGVGIGCSQLRNMNKTKISKSFTRKCISLFFVLGFYLFLSLFSQTYISPSIMINIKFLFSLFNFYLVTNL